MGLNILLKLLVLHLVKQTRNTTTIYMEYRMSMSDNQPKCFWCFSLFQYRPHTSQKSVFQFESSHPYVCYKVIIFPKKDIQWVAFFLLFFSPDIFSISHFSLNTLNLSKKKKKYCQDIIDFLQCLLMLSSTVFHTEISCFLLFCLLFSSFFWARLSCYPK